MEPELASGRDAGHIPLVTSYSEPRDVDAIIKTLMAWLRLGTVGQGH